jgi:hypothetical protein
MACVTLLAQPMAMTTTQLARATHCETAHPRQFEGNVERNSPRMSALVTTRNGSRQLRMRWALAEDCETKTPEVRTADPTTSKVL